MMAFMVDGDFVINATLLDNLRLGKQRVEGMQILNILLGKTTTKA